MECRGRFVHIEDPAQTLPEVVITGSARVPVEDYVKVMGLQIPDGGTDRPTPLQQSRAAEFRKGRRSIDGEGHG